MGYGRLELQYAEPFAEALVSNSSFRAWVIRRTEFSEFGDARLLHEEMKDRRSPSTKYWWRSHFTEVCRCAGCSGKETDLLAIFETDTGLRFALHIEVKHPGDKFKADGIQSSGYPLRAQCWITNPPMTVLPHQLATTLLLFSQQKREEYAAHIRHFKSAITFEDIGTHFPTLLANSLPRRILKPLRKKISAVCF